METLTFCKRDDTDREGNALVNKQGKPFTRLTIKVESKGDRYISGFANEGNKNWRVGDEVDIIITESKTLDKNGKPYLNFSLTKKEVVQSGDMKEIKDELFKVIVRVGAMHNDLRILMEQMKVRKPESYPTREDEGMSQEDPF